MSMLTCIKRVRPTEQVPCAQENVMLRERMAGVIKGVQSRGLPHFLAFQESPV